MTEWEVGLYLNPYACRDWKAPGLDFVGLDSGKNRRIDWTIEMVHDRKEDNFISCERDKLCNY